MRWLPWIAVLFGLGGCSGEFVLTAPDVVALPEQNTAMIVRLQRSELGRYAPPCADVCLTVRLGQGQLQAARTDSAGYAVLYLAGAQPGRYGLEIEHVDLTGDRALGKSNLYVLAPDKPITAVDLDSLPRSGLAGADAAAALRRLEGKTQWIYVTQEFAQSPAQARRWMAALNYPDGPVVPVRRWALMQNAGTGQTISTLRNRLPLLTYGLAADQAGTRTLKAAGLQVLYVGKAPPPVAVYGRFAYWKDLDLAATATPAAKAPAASQPATAAASSQPASREGPQE